MIEGQGRRGLPVADRPFSSGRRRPARMEPLLISPAFEAEKEKESDPEKEVASLVGR